MHGSDVCCVAHRKQTAQTAHNKMEKRHYIVLNNLYSPNLHTHHCRAVTTFLKKNKPQGSFSQLKGDEFHQCRQQHLNDSLTYIQISIQLRVYRNFKSFLYMFHLSLRRFCLALSRLYGFFWWKNTWDITWVRQHSPKSNVKCGNTGSCSGSWQWNNIMKEPFLFRWFSMGSSDSVGGSRVWVFADRV